MEEIEEQDKYQEDVREHELTLDEISKEDGEDIIRYMKTGIRRRSRSGPGTD